MSRKVRPVAVATAWPTVVFPEPGSPMRTRCGLPGSAAESGFEVRKVGVIVPFGFGDRVAAELFQKGIGENDGHHRLRNHSHRGDSGHIAPLGRCRGGLSGRNVDCTQRTHQGTDWLHGYTNN